MASRGVYVLTLHVNNPARLTVGKLGRFDFPRGYYLYVGSAMGGFAGRINRHLRRKKKMRWHIDYLLKVADLLWIDLYDADNPQDECRLNKKIAGMPGEQIICPGFGSSDCGCRSHLHYFEELPSKRASL